MFFFCWITSHIHKEIIKTTNSLIHVIVFHVNQEQILSVTDMTGTNFIRFFSVFNFPSMLFLIIISSNNSVASYILQQYLFIYCCIFISILLKILHSFFLLAFCSPFIIQGWSVCLVFCLFFVREHVCPIVVKIVPKTCCQCLCLCLLCPGFVPLSPSERPKSLPPQGESYVMLLTREKNRCRQ